MDNVRGYFGRSGVDSEAADDSWDESLRDGPLAPLQEDEAPARDDEVVRQEPPPEIGKDERRMQVRAYNHWASLLDDRNFPSIEDLEPENLPDFGPFSVLLDFTSGMEDPAVPYLGAKLAVECGADGDIDQLSEVPSRSLLSRITDHYMQILANQAPIGFEAEFVNQRGATILYRGILLPFSSDDDSIDFIYGVINWKEMADQITTDELLLEIDQVLDGDGSGAFDGDLEDESEDELEDEFGDGLGDMPAPRNSAAMADWADGPGSPVSDLPIADPAAAYDEGGILPAADALPSPAFGALSGMMAAPAEGDAAKPPIIGLDLGPAPAADPATDPTTDFGAQFPADVADGDVYVGQDQLPTEAIPAEMSADLPIELPVHDETEFGLYDCLAAARELAYAARSCEDRSRTALYDAVGRAYDVSLAANEEPEEFEQLVNDNGLIVQDRAPMTPVVKLVFGADYDKTRLTEYAAVLGHAHRIGVERGSLAGFLRSADGGLKGVVTAERRLRREESGKPVEEIDGPSAKLTKKLRAMEPQSLDDIAQEGPEFGLVMIRRMPDGSIALLGEVADDLPMVERAGRKLLAES